MNKKIEEVESLRTKMQEIKAALSKIDDDFKSLKLVKANGNGMGEEKEDEGPEIEDVIKYFDARIGYVYEAIGSVRDMCYGVEDRLYKYAYEHQNGHLPPIKSPSGMEAALKAIGLEKDYQVAKPMVVVANTQRGKVFTAEYIKK